MNFIFDILQRRPLIGLLTSVSAGGLGLSAQNSDLVNRHLSTDNPTIDAITPYLSFFALGVGVAVGVLTLILKALELRDRRRKNKENK